jgi:hypothetical protein
MPRTPRLTLSITEILEAQSEAHRNGHLLVWTDLAGQRSIGVCECGASIRINGDNAFHPVVVAGTDIPHSEIQLLNKWEQASERRRLSCVAHPSIPVVPKPGPGKRPPLTADFARQQNASLQWNRKKR